MVTLTTDHNFQIAATHLREGKPCQDYALSGVLADGTAYAVVADGCSSGRETDIGARVIARACVPKGAFAYQPLENLPAIVRSAQHTALRVVIPVLKLELLDLVATSVMALVTPADGGMVYLRGDGAIALMHRDGRLEVYSFEPELNAPIYPAYVLDDYAGVKAQFGTDGSRPSLSWQRFMLTETDAELLEEDVLTLDEAREGFILKLTPDQIADLRYVAVFTDGVMQVQGVPWQSVVRQMMAFKGAATGQFAVRRMNRFIHDKAEGGKALSDDLGCAVIQITADPTPKENE